MSEQDPEQIVDPNQVYEGDPDPDLPRAIDGQQDNVKQEEVAEGE